MNGLLKSVDKHDKCRSYCRDFSVTYIAHYVKGNNVKQYYYQNVRQNSIFTIFTSRASMNILVVIVNNLYHVYGAYQRFESEITIIRVISEDNMII